MSRRNRLGRRAATAAILWIGATAIAAVPAGLAAGAYSEAQAEHGAKLYGDNCASCHGQKLTGGAGPALAGAFWSSWNGRSVKELYLLVRGSMPQNAPSSLSDSEYAAIVAYLAKQGGYPAGPVDLPPDPAVLASIRIGHDK